VKVGLVLGAGGTVGLAYHSGALHALEDIGGFRPQDADLIVGTSAGSVIGSYLRTGWTTTDFWQFALGTHPHMAPLGRAPRAEPLVPTAAPDLPGRDLPGPEFLAPAYRGPVDFVRRSVGSAYVLSRSAVRVPVPVVPKPLRAAFPAGIFVMSEGRRRFAKELPAAWPPEPLWLCAVDIVSGRRIVLGSRGSPPMTLQKAVMASCAIPGVYPPVPLGRRVLIDGGVHSTTNLDLAVRAGCEMIIAVAPMAYDSRLAPGWVGRAARRVPMQSLNREVALARRRGVRVLLVRPSATEVGLHGYRLMRSDGLDLVARAAFGATRLLVRTDRFRRALDDLAA